MAYQMQLDAYPLGESRGESRDQFVYIDRLFGGKIGRERADQQCTKNVSEHEKVPKCDLAYAHTGSTKKQ